MKNYLFILLVIPALFLSSCEDDEDDMENENVQTIAALAQDTDGLDSLVVALSEAGLVETFNGTTEYTVFAPNNQAFVDLLAALSLNSIADIPEATLTAVLQYHVVTGTVMSSDLSDGLNVVTLESSSFIVNINGSNVTITDQQGNTVNVTAVDIEASNGVVHLIDGVIQP